MRLPTVFLTLTFFLFVFSCSSDRHNFKIDVHVNDSDGGILYLSQRTISGSIPVDSAMPDKSGRYVLKGYATQPGFYIVYHNPGIYINLIVHPGDDFRVITDANTFDRNYLVEGSADSRLIQKMVNMQMRTLEKITQLTEQYENSQNTENFPKVRAQIDSAYERAFNEHKEFSIELIEENSGSLASLMALYQQLGRNAPVFDYKSDFRYYQLVDSSLNSKYPDSEPVIDLNRKVNELRDILLLELGASAPDISLPDATGKQVRLSSLRGKYVVLLFWASWSSRSLEYLNNMARLYGKTGTDLEYYQVSIDRTKESWQQYATDAGIHVSDLKYWDSPVVRVYHIEKLPVIYLLDPQGKIAAKDFDTDELSEIIRNSE